VSNIDSRDLKIDTNCLLGTGAFGRVLRAELTLHKPNRWAIKQVAVKQLYANADDEGVREFIKEARIMFRTEHRNIVKV
jgi:hypothetical protein